MSQELAQSRLSSAMQQFGQLSRGKTDYPIEQVFSKLKAALRKGAARTVTRLIKLIGRLAKTLSPDECANYFAHAGYGA